MKIKAIPVVPGGRMTPMGAHPPEDPRLDPDLVEAYESVQPPAFADHPESAVEAADSDVDDTIGGE